MTGDAPAIMRLYREMIGEELPEDLSHIWPVRLGEATEQLNLDWYEEGGGSPVTRRGEVVGHPKHLGPPQRSTDRSVLCCPIEVKHVGGRVRAARGRDRSLPTARRGTGKWEVSAASQCALSVIMGANPPIIEYIERDADYAAEMVRRGQQFIACVAARREPVVLDPVPAPADATKIYDMSGNNYWSASAAHWLETKAAARFNKDAEKILKRSCPMTPRSVTATAFRSPATAPVAFH